MLAAALLALGFAQGPSASPREPGLVVLFGANADRASVPELDGASVSTLHLRIAHEDEPRGENANELRLPLSERRAADEPALVERVRDAKAIEFDPAPLHEWLTVLFPDHRDSELVRVLRESHRDGCTMIGRGESAALLSAATVVDDAREIGKVVRDPHDVGRTFVVWGLGFQPWAVFDEGARSHGSLQRLLESIEDDRLRLGFWIEDTSALVLDLRAGCVTARGAGAVLVIDPRGARSSRGEMREVGLSLLRAGDRWWRRERRAEIVGAVPFASANSPALAQQSVEHALEFGTLRDALAALGPSAPSALEIRDAQRSVRIEFEADTRRRSKDSAGAQAWSGLVARFAWPAPPR